VCVAAGPIFFGPVITGAFLLLAGTSPVDGCTQTGLDGGATPLALALDADLIAASFSASTRDEFLKEGRRDQQQVRRVVWEGLSRFRVRAIELEGTYLGSEDVIKPSAMIGFAKRIPRASTHPHSSSAAPLGQGDPCLLSFNDSFSFRIIVVSFRLYLFFCFFSPTPQTSLSPTA